MPDHIGLNVSDYDRSRDFYQRALQPLGFSLMMEPVPRTGGFGTARPWTPSHAAALGRSTALRWQDVDLATGVIRVERAWDAKEGVAVEPKSRSGRRRVPIAAVLREPADRSRGRSRAAIPHR